jgi:hypothetical protein
MSKSDYKLIVDPRATRIPVAVFKFDDEANYSEFFAACEISVSKLCGSESKIKSLECQPVVMGDDSEDEDQMDIVCRCGHRRWEHSRLSSAGQGRCEACDCGQFHQN